MCSIFYLLTFLPYQVLSATLEWSVISMLKEFIFVVIIASAYLTWHSTFLFPEKVATKGQHRTPSSTLPATDKSEDRQERNMDEAQQVDEQSQLSSNALLATDKDKGKDTGQDEETDKDEDTNQDIQDTEKNQVHNTCSALGHCLCALGLCFFAPCTSSCCRFARGENPYSFTFYLSNGFWFFWRGFQLRFLTAFGAFSSGLVKLLSAPVQNEEERFFAMKSSLTAIWVPCVVGGKNLTCS